MFTTISKLVFFFGGLIAFLYGCALIYQPLAYLVGGLLLFAWALLLEARPKA